MSGKNRIRNLYSDMLDFSTLNYFYAKHILTKTNVEEA